MGRTHINLLSTQKNVLADCLLQRGCVWLRVAACACVRACAFSFFLSPPATWKPDKAERKTKVKNKKNKHHLYVNAHLWRGENNVQMDATCRRMSFKNSIKQHVGLTVSV